MRHHPRGGAGARLAGRALVLTGTLLIAWAGAGWTRASLARDHARSAWEAREARLAVVAATSLPVGDGPSDVPPAAGAPVARLRIPRLALDEVVVEGVDEGALEAGPGHIPATPLPGGRGNAVLSAHRDRHFRNLDEVAVGDTLVTESDAGHVTWVVTGRRVVPRTARAIHETADATLTLTTCWPVRFLGPAPDRLLVTAKPVARVARR